MFGSLKSLVLTYVNVISSGDLPCMENAVLVLAQIENLAAMKKVIVQSNQQIGGINASNLSSHIHLQREKDFTGKSGLGRSIWVCQCACKFFQASQTLFFENTFQKF